MSDWHECRRVSPGGIFECRSCDFVGSLSQACTHIVENQFVVKPRPTKRSNDALIYSGPVQRRERSRKST